MGRLSVYGLGVGAYNYAQMRRWGMGRLIQEARRERGWNQATLGMEAGKVVVRKDRKPINANTVGDVERDPCGSKMETVVRILAALGLSFTELERQAGHSFVPHATIDSPAAAATPTDELFAALMRVWPDLPRSSRMTVVANAQRQHALLTAGDHTQTPAPPAAIPATAGRKHRGRKPGR